MANTRFKGETAAERLDFSGISDSDMIQLRHKPGTIDDADKGISKANLLSCPFGVSDTAAGTAAKTASLTDSNPDFSLVSGREVVVCFTTANSASTPTLNFAGSGAYPIYYPDGSAVGAWAAGTWMHLKYFSATVGGNAIQRWILLTPLPVDTVAANNMNSVTSNAVAQALNNVQYANIQIAHHGDYIYLYKFGKVVYMSLSSDWTGLDAGWNYNLATIPQGYRPIAKSQFKETTTDTNVTLFIDDEGSVYAYNYDSAFNTAKNGQYYGCWITEE